MTFIDNVLIVIVDSETKKARDDPTAGLESLESVQRIDHVGAPPAPRDMATMTGHACHHLFHTKCYIQ